jgi:hypothetical protein
MTAQQFDVLEWIDDGDWPFETSDERIAAINSTLPSNMQFVRRSTDYQSGFYLLRLMSEEGDGGSAGENEAETIANVITSIYGHNPQMDVSDMSAADLLEKLDSKFGDETVDEAVEIADWGLEYKST